MTITATDIRAALTDAGIDYTVQHAGTIIESTVVTRTDGRVVAFSDATTETGDATDGVDVAYYIGGPDTEVRTQDYITTTTDIADLVLYCGRDWVASDRAQASEH